MNDAIIIVDSTREKSATVNISLRRRAGC